ncbi:hypothetical protein JCM10213_002047 [Rhodosporidiobolus nylandii]
MPAALPRRTAWTGPADLQLVYANLFNLDGDVVLQRDALSRIKVWIARGNCPHAVESTANLLELLLADSQAALPSTSAARAPSPAELRLSYSMAMIRFVNSLVDPLQTTYYARSIASLAQQIGLPLWFVELRHQATHEELPALGVLRDAARQALDWLFQYYWHPLLHSAPSSVTLPPLPLSTLRPLLGSYKSLLKTCLKDASLAPRLKNDLLRAYKDIERWVADNALGGKGSGEKALERALGGVVECLVGEAGGLVPVAKKKRPTPRAPSLSSELLSLWSPLLTRLESTYSTSSTLSFTDLVVARCVELLCSPAAPAPAPSEGEMNPAEDKTYAATLVAWVVQLVVIDSAADEQQHEDGKSWDEQTEAVVKQCLLAGTPTALTLLTAILTARRSLPSLSSLPSDPLADKVEPLIQLLRTADSGFSGPAVGVEEAEERVRECERRRGEVEARLDAHPAPPPPTAPPASASPSEPTAAPAASLAPAAAPAWPAPVPNWTPRPIGALPGGRVEGLDLPPLPVAV